MTVETNILTSSTLQSYIDHMESTGKRFNETDIRELIQDLSDAWITVTKQGLSYNNLVEVGMYNQDLHEKSLGLKKLLR